MDRSGTFFFFLNKRFGQNSSFSFLGKYRLFGPLQSIVPFTILHQQCDCNFVPRRLAELSAFYMHSVTLSEPYHISFANATIYRLEILNNNN